MPIKSQGRDLYPLELCKINSGGITVYDRSAREKSYFYLAITTEGAQFVTSDGLNFCVKDRGFFSVKEK